MNRLDLDGVLVPITTPLRDDEVALDALRENLRRFSRTALRGFLVLGSTGEFVALDERESAAVLETARQAITADRVMIAGATAESTRGALELGRRAARIGSDAVLVGVPSYFQAQVDDESLRRHYMTIADRLEIPVLLYSVPKFTHRPLDPGLVARLATHPNIIGIKESGDCPERLLAPPAGGPLADDSAGMPAAERDWRLLSGHAPTFARALGLGYTGGILAVANVDPELCCAVHQALRQGDENGLAHLQIRMERLGRAFSSTGIGGIKRAMAWRGLFGGAPRPPLQSPDRVAEARLRQRLEPVLSPGQIGEPDAG